MFPAEALRQQFPALLCQRDNLEQVFLDGPGGTQVPRRVIEAITHYLVTCNANHGGAFATSRESDRIVRGAQEAIADFLNAPSPHEVIFGANMTTLTLHLSRALGRTLRPGDEVVVTRLDHDANVSPWVLAARDAGATVRRVDVRPEDCTLDMEDLRRQLNERTRLVAVTCASNLVGTVNDVAAIARLVHGSGALLYLDAVHYAPHGLIDVQAWDCDFLVCSAYKFFGPHVGILWGRRKLLQDLPAYKVRPASDAVPDRWMTGTQNHEGIAGVAAAVEYLAAIGGPATAGDRRSRLHTAMAAIRSYEIGLAEQLLNGLAQRGRFKVWGLTATDRPAERVPTISFTVRDRTAGAVVEHLAARNIFAWSGNLYALELTERLGLEESGGVVRVGLVHYNTASEVDRLLAALDEMS